MMTIATERLSARAAALLLTIFVTGLFQDLLRKSIPGQPVWLLVSFLVPAVGGLFLIRLQGLDLSLQATLRLQFSKGRSTGSWLKSPLLWMAGCVLLIASVVRLKSGLTTATLMILLLGWVGPVVALLGFVWGKVFLTRLTSVDQKMVFTSATIGLFVFCLGSFMELLAPDDHSMAWLGPMPPYRPWYRTVDADRFRMLCGFFRSPENAGWFSAMLLLAGCLMVATKRLSQRWTQILIGTVACAVCLLAGRRKMQLMMLIAVTVAPMLMARAGLRMAARQTLITAGLALLLGCVVVACVPKSHLYLGYFSTSPFSAPSRALVSTVEPILAYSDRIQWFGRGLGEMAPGRQHFSGSPLFFSEGGLVRVFVETGWLGLIVFLFAVIAILFQCFGQFSRVRTCRAGQEQHSRTVLAAGATAVLCASLFCFVIGHQVFGDPFITFLVGSALAIALPDTPQLKSCSPE